MPPPSFDAHTTAEQAVTEIAKSIVGKTVIVTGASLGGLGGETARVLAKAGAGLVILAGRSEEKLDEAVSSIKLETPGANLRKLVLDLASLESVRSAATEVNAIREPIDVLINNAGIMGGPYAVTVDGFEAQFATNHLGHFLFTNLIRPQLLASSAPRVVNVSSNGHRLSDIRYDDVGFSGGKTYDMWKAYGQSKTANMLFAVGLTQRGIPAFSLHPGVIWTNLPRQLTNEDMTNMGFIDEKGEPNAAKYPRKSLAQGAATQVVAAFDPSIANKAGSYLDNAQLANDAAQPYALDKENAEKLWALSEKLLGETFP